MVLFDELIYHTVTVWTEAKQHDRSSEYNLMNLNRCVAIECPEINIPWFLENYCVDKWLKRSEFLSVPSKVITDSLCI